MKKRKRTFALKILIFCLLILPAHVSSSQVRNYKANEKIDLGVNEQIKIIRCKGEGTDMQCEVVHLVFSKQVGNSFWLTANAIQKYEIPIKTTKKVKPLVKASSNVLQTKTNFPVKKSTIVKGKSIDRPIDFHPKPQVKTPNDFAIRLNQATTQNRPQKSIDSVTKIDTRKVDSTGKQVP